MRFDSTGLALTRLLQIASPSLPTGAFSYSQGLEWAVEAGWVTECESYTQWLKEQLDGAMVYQELPLLKYLYQAYSCGDHEAARRLCATVIALRETSELRDEERQRGRAMLALTSQIQNSSTPDATIDAPVCQLGAFAQYCAAEKIPLDLALQGYTYSWLESQVMAAIKLVPLGQTAGQQILYALSAEIGAVIDAAKLIDEADIGYSNPAQLFASCQHETQYCRLFRS